MAKNRSFHFDLEQWLRHVVGQDGKTMIGQANTIVHETDGVVATFTAGGAIKGKTGTDAVARWSIYPGATFESVTHHHWKQSAITRIMCCLEADYGNPNQLRLDRLCDCAMSHDLSEIVGTDVNYHVKNRDASTMASHMINDRVAHDQVMSGLRPEYRAYFPAPMDINPAFPEKERQFWDCAEKVGYCLFMLEEIRLGKISPATAVKFHQDVAGYIKRFEGAQSTFASVKVMNEVEIRPKWQRLAAKIKRMAKKIVGKKEKNNGKG